MVAALALSHMCCYMCCYMCQLAASLAAGSEAQQSLLQSQQHRCSLLQSQQHRLLQETSLSLQAARARNGAATLQHAQPPPPPPRPFDRLHCWAVVVWLVSRRRGFLAALFRYHLLHGVRK